jgi:acyl-CoA thioester hydrolase
MSRFCYSHRVTYADCTVGDHIYYGRYLELLEAARGEFFRSLGAPFRLWQDRDTIFPVRECRICYKSAARYDDVLGIEVWVMAAEGARLDFSYRVLNQAGALVLEAETFHVCTGRNGKPRRLPGDLLAQLAPNLAQPAATKT